jgi:hypothetical protein
MMRRNDRNGIAIYLHTAREIIGLQPLHHLCDVRHEINHPPLPVSRL